MKKYFLLVIPLSIVLMFVMLGHLFDKIETSETRFSTYHEMEKSAEMAKGWIPDLLPYEAVNIVEWHNIDTNRVIVTYSYQDKFIKEAGSADVITCHEVPDCDDRLESAGFTLPLNPSMKSFAVKNARDRAVLVVDEAQKTVKYVAP